MNASSHIELPRYVCHKRVHALQIAAVAMDDVRNIASLSFIERGYPAIEVSPALFARYMPVPGDYLVVYEDGYKSISPKKAFEEGYSPLVPPRRQIPVEGWGKDDSVRRCVPRYMD